MIRHQGNRFGFLSRLAKRKGDNFMHCFPFILSPLGWVALGAAGYLVYRAGKKSGKKETEKTEKLEKSAAT
jgi:hypothetical protein